MRRAILSAALLLAAAPCALHAQAADAAHPAQRWEYAVYDNSQTPALWETRDTTVREPDFRAAFDIPRGPRASRTPSYVELLNALGRQGWELVQCEHDRYASLRVCTFKRRVVDGAGS